MTSEHHGIDLATAEADRKRLVLEEKRMDLNAGLFGRLFGSKENAPTNIAGFVVMASFAGIGFLIVLDIVLTSFGLGRMERDLYTLLAAFISGALGYTFGRTR